MSECGAIWLPGCEVICQLELAHPGEHGSKVRVEYEDGQVGLLQLTWNQESQQTEEPQ